MKKVFVSGCYDMLHSGHVEFFQQASQYGQLHVALGSDQTVFDLKGRAPINNEEERRFMVESVGCVHQAFVSSGAGYLDFEPELRELDIDIFIVNEDGNSPDKRKLCRELGLEYVVLKREPHGGLVARSTTDLRKVPQMPCRIDLAGGWLDQPFVSEHYPGPVITLSLDPTLEFNERSGMASSTRRTAIEIWGNQLPVGDPAILSRILFCCDNPPGTEEVSGAQDTIGIVYAGLAYSFYNGAYWPSSIEQNQDEELLRFVESLIYLVPLGPRHAGYNVLGDTYISNEGAKNLADAAEGCWQAILAQDTKAFGQTVRASLEAQVAMFPFMMNPTIEELIEQYKDIALGWKISGAGGGGYLILVSEEPIEGGIQIAARRGMS
ncbi:MAG: adenylyltransferase/cytidyltransferase family protein [Chloroflexota bacterium]